MNPLGTMSASTLAGFGSIDALLLVGLLGSVDQTPADIEYRRSFVGLLPLFQKSDEVLLNQVFFIL